MKATLGKLWPIIKGVAAILHMMIGVGLLFCLTPKPLFAARGTDIVLGAALLVTLFYALKGGVNEATK
jgi:hypothetical protein